MDGRIKSRETTRRQQYERLGRQLAELFNELRPNHKALYRTSFLRGAAGGLGSIVGATVGIALLLWLLSLFSEVPILGHFLTSVRHTLQNHR